ncbi:hypothetical protein CD790_23110 [Streptomyces sp. SAJ15]|nr:hypothetical protein CD790_23110 [Streptomyces sp. SAJ15]
MPAGGRLELVGRGAGVFFLRCEVPGEPLPPVPPRVVSRVRAAVGAAALGEGVAGALVEGFFDGFPDGFFGFFVALRVAEAVGEGFDGTVAVAEGRPAAGTPSEASRTEAAAGLSSSEPPVPLTA